MPFGPHCGSDTDLSPKPPWRERKEAYIESIPHQSPEALPVSLADKVHNAGAILNDYREVHEDVWKRFVSRGDQLWYYRALADALGGLGPSPLWQRLEDTVRRSRPSSSTSASAPYCSTSRASQR